MSESFSAYWPHLAAAFSVLNVALILVFLPWVLLSKKDATATVSWCLLVLFVPVLGAFLFWGFGYNYLAHRVRHQRGKQAGHRKQHPHPDGPPSQEQREQRELGELAERLHAFPMRRGNALTVYHETEHAFNALVDAIAAAQKFIHLEFFILRSDATGDRLYNLLAHKAKEGIEVRLLYDGMGCLHLKKRSLEPMREAGVRVAAFLPLNPLHSLIRINLRNHRKIVVVDGRIGFTGGMNIGDEYLGKSSAFGYWRDSFLRLEGPAVSDLQRVFGEDWEFAKCESLSEEKYAPPQPDAGGASVQIADSGPDQATNTIREIYFLAMTGARRRLWIASPYLVPDSGLFDAPRSARYRGVDVRILTLLRPDHYISYYAGLYYAADLLAYGVKIQLYRKGMMHAKLIMVDGLWGMIGSANLDNRSLHLNFEVGCILHDADQVAQLEEAFQRDLEDSVPLDQQLLERRSLASRGLENACRLFTPAL